MDRENRAPPSAEHNDPFATPPRLSAHIPNGVMRPSPPDNRPVADPSSHNFAAMEIQAGEPVSTRGRKRPLAQRWKEADERAYMATFGRLGAGKKSSPNGEKDIPSATRGSAAPAPRRRTLSAWRCTIIVAILMLLAIVIVAIVAPIAVVFGQKHDDASSSSSGSDPDQQPQAQNSDVVTLNQGQYQGTKLANGISSFLGMQYGAPPTGSLRFAAPQAPLTFQGIKAATKHAPACHSLGKFDSAQNEDCLYLDVYTPTSAVSNSSSKLPVYVFIQGGGLQGADAYFNGSDLIEASGMDMITVTMTYRVNAFGFLASSELQSNKSLNVGLKDQRQALHWVQDNIAQFGGDPGHVVLGGQSAGAGSGVLHLTAYGGRNDSLFSAALFQSQSLQAVRDVKSSQFQYDYIVGNTSCASSKDTLACLRGLSVQNLVAAIKTSPFPDGAGGDPVFPYNPVFDDDFIQDYPITAFAKGKFVDVPTIFGDVTNEGTIFIDQAAVTDQASANAYLRDTFPLINDTMLDQYSGFYALADDAAASPYWQRAAAAYGDTRYTCPGIHLSDLVLASGANKVWNYHYDVLDPTAEAQGLGVKHGSEMPAVWGPWIGPASYAAGHVNAPVIPLVQAYWTSFIKNFDPSVGRLADAPEWRPWTAGNRLHILVNDTAMENVDAGQATRCKYLSAISVDIGQ